MTGGALIIGVLGLLTGCRSPQPVLEDSNGVSADSNAADSGVPAAPFVPDMVLIPAGTFVMGCADPPEEDPNRCVPTHEVTLTRDYLIGVTEVTSAQFSSVMGYSPPAWPEVPEADNPGDNAPANAMHWSESAAFANTVSVQAGLSACYSCTGSGPSVVCLEAMDPYACPGYRLPTEAEWENAARCNSPYLYSGSDDNLQVAWTMDNSQLPGHAMTTRPVATLAPNACGTYDMSGNVFEYVEDVYLPYSADAQTDPNAHLEPENYRSDFHVMRGGDAVFYTYMAEIGFRGYIADQSTSTGPLWAVGFRLARTSPHEDSAPVE